MMKKLRKIANSIVFSVLLLLVLAGNADAARLLIPGGQAIGLELGNDTVTVAAIDDALGAQAQAAGLAVGDRILRVGERAVTSAEDVRSALTHSDGAVDILILRNGETKLLRLQPHSTADGPRLGVYLRQGVTGIGTVTYYDPQNGQLGALGHGVNDSEGALVQMTHGSVYAATVASVRKGAVGEPGQLLGALSTQSPIGVLSRNTPQGVFGTLQDVPGGETLPAGSAEQIHTGSATIRTTVADSVVREYSVEILKIYPKSRQNGRNLLIQVTDPALLETTGGIVQGMSGSPIIQDGQLVGAVTHVLVNDPTTGYGIFIENMLDAAA